MHAISHFSKGLAELAAAPVPRDELDAIPKIIWMTERSMVLPPIAPKSQAFS